MKPKLYVPNKKDKEKYSFSKSARYKSLSEYLAHEGKTNAIEKKKEKVS